MRTELDDIREIVDYHTQCCRYCDDGSYEHCMHPECDTYIARIMREEIIELLDKKEAEDLGEAIEKARNGNYELPDLNNGDYIEDYLVNVLDENYNQVHEFGE